MPGRPDIRADLSISKRFLFLGIPGRVCHMTFLATFLWLYTGYVRVGASLKHPLCHTNSIPLLHLYLKPDHAMTSQHPPQPVGQREASRAIHKTVYADKPETNNKEYIPFLGKPSDPCDMRHVRHRSRRDSPPLPLFLSSPSLLPIR